MEYNLNKWRFPGSNYATESDLSTPDMETFKRDPLASLARESCQNSIDARSGEESVFIEFKTFEISSSEIPGIKRLKREIKSCKLYKKDSEKTHEALTGMLESIEEESVPCLRISDFHTTGLLGVADNVEKFYSLTKGSGITDKTLGTTGGSKGIGKFSSFVTSSFHTVFYSTLTETNEEGYLGISKLCSSPIENSDDKTQGIGYFSSDDKNSPILQKFKLDPSFERVSPGTDIYILGFKSEKDWENDIISKVLESFLVAIYFGHLKVKVDDILISKETLGDVIEKNSFISKRHYKHISSQYILLTDPSVHKTEVNIMSYGNLKLFVKAFSKENKELATNSCVMVRYPYMKIKDLRSISNIPCSAMAIIENDGLNKILHEIENPQHTDWEPNRIDSYSKRKEIQAIIRKMNREIRDFVKASLISTDNRETDIEGASDYLPESQFSDGDENEIGKKSYEKPLIVAQSTNRTIGSKGYEDSKDSLSYEEGFGEYGNDEEGAISAGEKEVENKGENLKNQGEGNAPVIAPVKLRGLNYRFFITDKNKGEAVISFTSLFDIEKTKLRLNYLDDSFRQRYKVNILSARLNGVPLYVGGGEIKNLQIESGKKYKIEVTTDLKELYVCEVVMYENR